MELSMMIERKRNLTKARRELAKALTDGDDRAIVAFAERYVQASADYADALRRAEIRGNCDQL